MRQIIRNSVGLMLDASWKAIAWAIVAHDSDGPTGHDSRNEGSNCGLIRLVSLRSQTEEAKRARDINLIDGIACDLDVIGRIAGGEQLSR